MQKPSIYSEVARVGDNIKRALAKRGKTQKWLAEEISTPEKEISISHINKWCTNRNIPTPENLEKIASALDYSQEELITGDFHDEVRVSDKKTPYGDSPLKDPVIKAEINSVLTLFEEACARDKMSEDEITKYKKLVEGKIKSMIEYSS